MKKIFISIIRLLFIIYRKIEVFLHRTRLRILKSKFKFFGDGADFAKHIMFKGRQCISIGENSYIDEHSVISAWTDYRGKKYFPTIEIGKNCHIGAYNHITAINRIVIGDGVLTGKWVTITDNSHGQLIPEQIEVQPALRTLHSKGNVIIEKNVWICDKATIVAGVIIGEGVIVAANAVVTKNVPPYSLVAGNPAKIVKTL